MSNDFYYVLASLFSKISCIDCLLGRLSNITMKRIYGKNSKALKTLQSANGIQNMM